jgi:hypothetical protein
MPDFVPQFDPALIRASQELSEKWVSGGQGTSPKDIEGWSTDQIGKQLCFMRS